MSKSNQAAVKKYQAGRDAIMLRPPLEDGQAIRAAAAAAGQSVNAYIMDALTAYGLKLPSSAPGQDPENRPADDAPGGEN